MKKQFAVPILIMLIILTEVGCATQSTVNYGRALTPAESAPPPVRISRKNAFYRSSKKYPCPVCEHQVPLKYINTDLGAVNTCPACGSHFPYIEEIFCDERERARYTTHSYHWGL